MHLRNDKLHGRISENDSRKKSLFLLSGSLWYSYITPHLPTPPPHPHWTKWGTAKTKH